MSILKSKTTNYEFSLEEMSKLIANDLGFPVEAITVSYIQQDVSNDRFDRFPNYQVTKVQVKVDETKLPPQK